MKLYWNIAMPICLHTVYGWFHGTTAELSSCDRDLCSAKLKSSPSGFLPKSLPNSRLEQKCPVELCVMMEMFCRSVLSSRVATGHTGYLALEIWLIWLAELNFELNWILIHLKTNQNSHMQLMISILESTDLGHYPCIFIHMKISSYSI